MVLIIGGRGFLGQAVCKYLKAETFDRQPGKKSHHQGSINSQADLNAALKGHTVVINLAGLTPTRQPKGTSYQAVHIDGVRNLIAVCKKRKAKLIHISAIGADRNSKTEYLRTKGVAEHLLLQANLDVTIIRPSVIYDNGSELLKMMKMPFFPNFPGKVQPVYRDDLAKLIARCAKEQGKGVIEAGGPEKLTLYQMARQLHFTIPIPFFLFKIGFWLLILFHPAYTNDQLRLMQLDNTTSKNAIKNPLSFSAWLRQ